MSHQVKYPPERTIDVPTSFLALCVVMQSPTLTLGRRLAMAREDAGISVNEMADRLGLDRRTITSYERSKRPVPRPILLSYQVICDVPADFIEGRAALTQEVVSSRCTADSPAQGYVDHRRAA